MKGVTLSLFVILASTSTSTSISTTPTTTVNATIDCGAVIAPLPHLWRSCGYSPAESALRQDGVENTVRIGSTPRRGIANVRVHFLLDLLLVTGFFPNASNPSGYTILYDWNTLDFAMDTLVQNQLSPGFEFMGSPAGFPTLPQSFYMPWNNNYEVLPNQTLQMYRGLVRDLILHYVARYSVEEVSKWKFESWNEYECGWGWPRIQNASDPTFIAYQYSWDAITAGVADAETELSGGSTLFTIGGPGSCSNPQNSLLLQWILQHSETGVNVWTGAPARLDFLSIHYKGRSTSYLVAQQALAGFTAMREKLNVGPKMKAIPFYNDEADPMVGWLQLSPWRADARYGAIIPKVISQHLLQINDNETVTLNNPVGLLSNDDGFMNTDGYNGFEQRTLHARFTDTSTGKFAFVRKQGIQMMSLLSKLGTIRVQYSGEGTPDASQVASSLTGVIATVTPAVAGNSLDPTQVSVLIYNSNDTANITSDNSGDADVSVTLINHPFSSTDQVVLMHYRVDNVHGNANAVYESQGSPLIPTSENVLDMWAEDGLGLFTPTPIPINIPPPGQPLVLPSFILPLPGVSFLHLAARPSGATPPPTPVNVRAFIKPSQLSLLDATLYVEILIRWDCDAPYNSSNSSNNSSESGSGGGGVPSSVTFGYEVQVSTTGASGPWTTAQSANTGDFTCGYVHAASVSSSNDNNSNDDNNGNTTGNTYWYQIAAMDYWSTMSPFSTAVQAVPWPAIVA